MISLANIFKDSVIDQEDFIIEKVYRSVYYKSYSEIWWSVYNKSYKRIQLQLQQELGE